jgi:cytochrome P450 family 628
VEDVFTPILKEYEENKSKGKKEWDNLVADASTTVVAGSDTTASTLTCLLYLFVVNPAAYKKLQAEVDHLRGKDSLVTMGEPNNQDLAKLPYLQACIDEALRLFHPVPSGMQRVTPAEGLRIGSTFIPGDTIVQMSLYMLFRDPRCFAQPDEFIPERWTSRKAELVLDASVFQPFGVGRYSCPGKQLGLMELRRVTARIAAHYDIKLADGVEPAAIMEGMEDFFTLTVPELNLVFSHRQ